MLILAIETSTDNLGLALLEEEKLIGEYNLSLKRQHSEKLMPLMEQIFDLLDYKTEELDAVTVSIGPGSFTGLRIGITAAKTLARVFSIPVKGVSTLEVMASAVNDNYSLALLDARNERVYYSFFTSDASNSSIILKKLKKSAAAHINKLPDLLADYKNKKIKVVGQKKSSVTAILKENGFQIQPPAASIWDLPRAAVLAELGMAYIKKGKTDDIYQLKPKYLKKPQAEVDWQQKYK